MSLATAYVSIRPDTVGFGTRLSKSVGASADKAGTDAGKRMSSKFAGALKVGGALAAAFAVTKGVSFFKDSISGASDLNETMNKSQVIFGSQAGVMTRWSRTAATSLGLSRQAALDAASGFGDMFSQLGFGQGRAAAMSRDVVKLSADLGSFNNLPTAEVNEMISASFRGEYDSLQRVIPNINAARVQTLALSMSGKDNVTQLTAQEKAAATLAIIHKDGARATGDFARTSSGLANTQKILGARMDDLRATVGQALLPIITRLARFLSNQVLPAVQGFITGMQEGTGAGGKFADVATTLARAIGTVGRFLIDNKEAVGAFAGIILTVVAAVRIWTGAQALLNIVLTANPLGLVVVAIAAFVAGLILAYQHSATFRKIVNGAFNGVKNVASTVIGWFTDSFVPFFTDTIPGAFAATKGWVTRNWPAILAIITGPIGLATLFISRHWDTITTAFQDAKDWVVGGFKRNWRTILAVLAGPIGLAMLVISRHWDTITARFKDAKDWVVGRFKRAWSDVQGVLLSPIRDARDKIRDIFGARGPVRTAFANAVGGIKRIWSNLRDAVRDPIAFIVNTVFNKGIVPFVNRIPFIPGTLKTIQGFETGGWTGPGGRDRPAGIVHADEHVWTKEESNRFPGGHRGLERLRTRARMGLIREGELAGYATGGRVLMDGKALSVIAARQIRLMERMAGVNFRVMQGGYGGSHIAASGTSHNYPGVADISPASIQYERLARRVGFAAWARNIPGRSRVGSGAHIHAVSLLDPGDARSAQVYGSWRNHGNGLSGANNDPAPHVPWLPNLRALLGNIPLANLGGGGGGGGYAGPTAADVRAGLNPAKWVRTLAGMGGWGRGLGGMVTGVVGNLRDAIVDKVKAAIRVAGRALTGGAGPVSGPVSQTVRRAANTYGWGQGDEWNALSNIISKESGWRPDAQNPTSSAYGLFQLTRANWPGGRKPTSVEAQAAAGLRYIQGRYRDPIGAWNWWQNHHWYDQGGVANGAGFIFKGPGKERVLSERQTETYDKLLPILERIERGNTGGTGPMRIILDAGGGVTLTGHIDNRIQGRAAQSATVRRQRR